MPTQSNSWSASAYKEYVRFGVCYRCYVPASGEVARAHEAIEVLERALTHVIFEIP